MHCSGDIKDRHGCGTDSVFEHYGHPGVSARTPLKAKLSQSMKEEGA